MKKSKLIALIVIAILAWGLSPSRAQEVLWGSPVGVDSETSDGTAVLDGSFNFQVGAFFENGVLGWTATAENAAEWADHWLSADSAVYNDRFRTFTGACYVDPAVAGKQGYIWGFDTKGGGEWILITDPAWVFPSGSSALSFPVSWQTSGATVVVMGAVDNVAGGSFHLKTANVAAAPVPYLPTEQWLGMYFSEAEMAEANVADWQADPDEDGVNNLMELALGSSPNQSLRVNEPRVGFVQIWGYTFLTLTIDRAPNVAVSYGAEVSSDLADWKSGPAHLTVMSETPTELVLRDNTPILSGSDRFIRLRVDLNEE